jgi:hypothetical protein
MCWTCDPKKHPSNPICRDCSGKGHGSKSSNRCSKYDDNNHQASSQKKEDHLLAGRQDDDLFQKKISFVTKKRNRDDEDALSANNLRNKIG